MNNKQMKKIFTSILLSTLFVTAGFAQDKVIDQIVAVVGGNVILKSDIEQMNMNQQAQGITSEGDMKCEILEEFLINKLLVAEAELDSTIEVSPSQVNQQMDAQIQSYLTYFGTESAVEAYFKKPMATIKSEMQEAIRDQLFSQQMRSKIVENVTVTPSEVRYYYRNLSKEQTPTIPTEYEYAQITVQPKIDMEEENQVKAKLREIKRRIENGSSFAAMAVIYSEDPGSAKDGGIIGYMGRGQLDPEYAAAAFNLKGDQVSNVVQSNFGYHIIQLVDKQGGKVNTRHILVRPKVTVEEKENAFNRLDSMANMIRRDEIPFDQAATMFSYDKNTRNNGGVAINPNNMSSKFSVEDLDGDISKILTTMKLNEISDPFETIDPENQQTIYKIVKLINKIDSHKADMQNDYQTLADLYLTKKKEDVLQEWIAKQQAQTYIRIDNTYANCNFKFENWIK